MARARNTKLDIIVGIPTYNEADSISNTVQKVDRGLSRYFPEHKALIVNIDSQSSDGTSRGFDEIKTEKNKMSLVDKKKTHPPFSSPFCWTQVWGEKPPTRWVVFLP